MIKFNNPIEFEFKFIIYIEKKKYKKDNYYYRLTV